MEDLGYVSIDNKSERAEAITALLAQPDPPELAGKRRYRFRYGGNKLKQEELKSTIAFAYLQYRLSEAGRRNGTIISVRRTRRI